MGYSAHIKVQRKCILAEEEVRGQAVASGVHERVSSTGYTQQEESVEHEPGNTDRGTQAGDQSRENNQVQVHLLSRHSV